MPAQAHATCTSAVSAFSRIRQPTAGCRRDLQSRLCRAWDLGEIDRESAVARWADRDARNERVGHPMMETLESPIRLADKLKPRSADIMVVVRAERRVRTAEVASPPGAHSLAGP